MKRLPKHIATFQSVHKWHKHMFERLGWLVLSQAKGFDYKIDAYKKSLEHLKKTIEHLMNEYENHNRLHDLKVLHMNVSTLEDFVMRNF
jgi:hypothetical protein